MHLIFAITCAVRCIRCGLKPIYFSNFGHFLLSPKLIFPFVLVQVLNYWANFSLFWVGFLNQHLLGLSNYFFFFFVGKTRVIKLLIIYLILKIIKYINIWKCVVRYGLCVFLIIKLQTALHHAVWCGAILLAVRCGCAILRAVCAVYVVW